MKDTFSFEGVNEARRRGIKNKSGHIRAKQQSTGGLSPGWEVRSILWPLTDRHSPSNKPPL